ncbi:MAG: ribonuclease HII [Gammaproteobacteria bacterium]|nr:ribonuclease HII [Gammaproteobacteria bacterium]
MNSLLIAGVDEAGRGALAGPVVSAAVLFSSGPEISGLTDSKKLSQRTRLDLEMQIKRSCACWAVGIATAEEIDRLNVLQATLLSMRRAVNGLTIPPDRVLVDGNHLPEIDYPGEAIIQGDLHEPVVSAASIIAKVTRDSMMQVYAVEYPGYGFERHVGYGTKLHLQSLSELGVTPIHRKTFAPVNQLEQTQIEF